MSGKVKAAVLVAAVVVISAVVSFVAVVAVAGNNDKIFPGVVIHDLSMGNMSREEAKKALTDYVKTLQDKSVTANFDQGSGQFRLSAIALNANIESMVSKAYAIGRQGNFLQQWQERKRIAKAGVRIPFDFTVSKDKLRVALDDMTKAVRIPPRDAKLVVRPDETIAIVESSQGKGINVEAAWEEIRRIIEAGQELELELSLVELKPALTTEQVKSWNVNGRIASFSTRFDIRKTNRVYNIRVAASALDGQIIKPGETFSFNKVVGPRSQEAGYKLAPTILNNEFIDSLGGGVCQVSTTLYNTLLQGDIDIVQRSNHSLVVKYVPLGQDAAVAYGGKDLKFKNNLPCAIILKAAVYGDTITLKIFGDTAQRKTVRIFNNTVKEYPFKIVYKNDPTKYSGQQVVDQKGVNGYRVTSYMQIYKDGKFVKTETLPSSHYSPLDQIILVGTKPGSKPVSGGNTGHKPPTNSGTTKPPGSTNPPPVTPPPTPPPTVPEEPQPTDPTVPPLE